MKEPPQGGTPKHGGRRAGEPGRFSPYALHLYLSIAGLLFLTNLILYISTLAPSVATLFDDSLEFQLVTYQLGIAHPTGYPLYTMLGKLFTFLPVGNVAYRVNLMSAVFGAATVAGLYLCIVQISQKITSISSSAETLFSNAKTALSVQLGGVTGALFLAISPVFWQQATIAEVYTLNSFFIVTILLLAIAPLPERQQKHRLLWLAFIVGLSLTHHRTMLLLLPALAVHLYLTQKSRLLQWRTVALTILLGILPLLLYLYLPLRGHVGSLDGTYKNSWAGFWQQVGGGGYGAFILDNPFGHERDILFFWNLLNDQFFTHVLGFFGIFRLLLSNQRKIITLTGLAFLTYLCFNIFYQVSDIEVFFIPIFLIWAMWSGIGVATLFRFATTVKGGKALQILLVGLFLFMLTYGIYGQLRKGHAIVDEKYSWQIHDYGLDILQQPLPAPPEKESVIIGILGEMTLIRYFQQTEQRRSNIETIAADKETERLAAVEQSLSQGKAVYLTRELPGAAARWSLSAVGPLIWVKPEPVTQTPDISFPKNQAVIDQISLLGYDISRPPHTGDGLAPVRLKLYWQAIDTLDVDLKVSARLLNATGKTVTATDVAPVHFAYPTTAWRLGEIVADVYDVVLPRDAPSGLYTPLIIWYDPAQNATEMGHIELEAITVE